MGIGQTPALSILESLPFRDQNMRVAKGDHDDALASGKKRRSDFSDTFRNMWGE